MPVCKVGAPGREELAIGAVAPGGVKVLNHDVIAALRLSDERVDRLVSKAAEKVRRQSELYDCWLPRRRHWPGRSVVVVDDGLATGASMWAALIAVRGQDPRRLILAVPWPLPNRSPSWLRSWTRKSAVCGPAHMQAVGAWYEDFSQTTEAEVAGLLAEFATRRMSPA